MSYDVVYHCDYVGTRTYMIILRIIAWIYGISLFFLFWLGIFPGIHKANITIFASQILYVLFLMSLAQRQFLRHTIIIIILTIFCLIVNGYMGFFFVYQLIECKWWKICNDNGKAFLYVTCITLLFFCLNVIILFISLNSFEIIKKLEKHVSKYVGEHYLNVQKQRESCKHCLDETPLTSIPLKYNTKTENLVLVPSLTDDNNNSIHNRNYNVETKSEYKFVY